MSKTDNEIKTWHNLSFAYAIYYDVYELQLPEHIHSVREKFGGMPYTINNISRGKKEQDPRGQIKEGKQRMYFNFSSQLHKMIELTRTELSYQANVFFARKKLIKVEFWTFPGS